ncbi:MAG: rRNA pseudouridine synthase [Verrucomicrobia bacterium]|nr:rRNA pseudouridine synthase [Verrucomicrobiota bacterium]
MSAQQLRRLDQWLANLGYCSRRAAPQFVRSGRVLVDGVRETNVARKVNSAAITVDGEALEYPHGLLIAMNKPLGVVCSHDERDGPMVYDLLPSRWMQRNPQPLTVGRLDKETSGCLIITDDGQLAHRWTSPKTQKCASFYEVTVDKPLNTYLIDTFAAGNLLLDNDSKPCLPAELIIHDDVHATLILTEGRYHQVRRMFAAEGWLVTALHRSRFGNVDVAGLAPGEWRTIHPDAV